MINLQVSEKIINPVAPEVVLKAAQAALETAKSDPRAELTIVLTDDEQV